MNPSEMSQENSAAHTSNVLYTADAHTAGGQEGGASRPMDRRLVSTIENDRNVTKSALTLSQRVAICFPAGVLGALAVVLFSHALFWLGLARHSG